jgi:hypothetical protein
VVDEEMKDPVIIVDNEGRRFPCMATRYPYMQRR